MLGDLVTLRRAAARRGRSVGRGEATSFTPRVRGKHGERPAPLGKRSSALERARHKFCPTNDFGRTRLDTNDELYSWPGSWLR